MRVTVTGGNGFLGRHVVTALRASDHAVEAPTSQDYDLRSGIECQDLINDTKPDAVVHLAARVGGIGDNVAKPGEFLYENAMMGLQLMEISRRVGVSKFLTVGTACMYPDHTPVPMKEDDLWNGLPAHDAAAYAHAKRLLLAQGQAYAEEYDFNAVCVVPSNLYGPGDDTTHVVPMMTQKFLEAAEIGDDVILWGSGSATRDFLYVEDAADGIAAALDHYNSPRPVNLGTGVETPIYALASAIAWELGFTGRIRWDPTRPEGTPRRALDPARAREQLGWVATTSLRAGLPKYLEWATKHPR